MKTRVKQLRGEERWKVGTETVVPLSPNHVVVEVAVAVKDFLRINPKFQVLPKGALLLLVVPTELLPLLSVTRKKTMHSHLPILLEHVLTCAQVNTFFVFFCLNLPIDQDKEILLIRSSAPAER